MQRFLILFFAYDGLPRGTRPATRPQRLHLPPAGAQTTALLGQFRRNPSRAFPCGRGHQDRRRGGQTGRGRGRRLRFARGIAGGRLRARRLPHAPQRHDGRLRPPPAFPRRHRAARAQGALRTPFERREPLVRSRNLAREAGRRGGLLGRQRFVGRPAPPLRNPRHGDPAALQPRPRRNHPPQG